MTRVLFSPETSRRLTDEFQSFLRSPDCWKAGAALKVGSSNMFTDMSVRIVPLTCLNLSEAVEKLITCQIARFAWNCTTILAVIKLADRLRGGQKARVIRPIQTDWKLDEFPFSTVAHVFF